MKRLVLLLVPLAAFAAAPTTDWSPNLTANIAWQGNATNGEAVWDRIGALDLSADVVASSQYSLSRDDAVHATAHFAMDWYPRFYRLGRGAAGARLDWQHRFGNDAFAPVFTVEAAGDGVAATDQERQGYLGAITLKLAQRLGRSWHVGVSDRFERSNARKDVYDSGSNEAGLEISRDINEATRLVLSGRWRTGDVVTYAQFNRPDLRAIARATVATNIFHQRMTAYATDARTIGGRIALVHATAEDTALILAYDYGATKRTDLRFENQTVSLSWVRQF